MLKSVFFTVFAFYDSNNLCETYWKGVLKAYSAASRYYHSLSHLQSVYNHLIPVKSYIEDWDVLMLTLFYHDYVYNPLSQNNELKSAKYAVKVLRRTSMHPERINRCCFQITATKTHNLTKDNDANFFNDADLSVLGSTHDIYSEYLANIRKEYWMYPNMVYKAGRRKVVSHFLSMSKIYKTPHFQDRFETEARINLERELNDLG
jgi:predicted metal-dependent HD superfamily phosphohydrolase